MNTLIFLRHGHSEANAKDLLTGRLPGIGLSPSGKRQALDLVERIGRTQIDYLHVSPIERCQLTIDPWLRSRYASSLAEMAINDAISEIDFGTWSGRKLSSLRRQPLWRDVQNSPSTVTFPSGESFRAAQRRSHRAVLDMVTKSSNKTHLIVSHSDVIKLISAKLLGMKLDDFQGIHISPSSFTVFTEDKGRFTLLSSNSKSSLKDLLGKI
jgi:probable phosphomutase (TIGR03848 family)